jgi:hypothetical protein
MEGGLDSGLSGDLDLHALIGIVGNVHRAQNRDYHNARPKNELDSGSARRIAPEASLILARPSWGQGLWPVHYCTKD